MVVMGLKGSSTIFHRNLQFDMILSIQPAYLTKLQPKNLLKNKLRILPNKQNKTKHQKQYY